MRGAGWVLLCPAIRPSNTGGPAGVVVQAVCSVVMQAVGRMCETSLSRS